MNKKFQRKIEDFVCENCGARVAGNGYTNHCPVCLWSKHVDINPGDRAADCQGLMQPVSVFYQKGKWRIKQQCLKCGHQFVVDSAKEDSQEALRAVVDFTVTK
jgi:ribosomal protein L37AE/L43A